MFKKVGLHPTTTYRCVRSKPLDFKTCYAMPSNSQVHLPDELLVSIFSCCTDETLAKLCRCSRKFNHIATPQLYSSVEFSLADTEPPTNQYLLPFAYLIFTSPLHAGFVKSFSLSVAGEEFIPNDEEGDLLPEDKKPWPSLGSHDTEELLMNVCRAYTRNKVDATELYESIRDGNEEGAIVALIIAHLNNLRKFDFSTDLAENDSLLWALEHISYSGLSSTPLDMAITDAHNKYPREARLVAGFLNIPSVRSFHAYKVGDSHNVSNYPVDEYARLKPQSCALELIELRCSKLHIEHYKSLMDATIPGLLKTFIYEFGCSWAWASVSQTRMIRDLEPHYDTLESLDLSHENLYPHHDYDMNDDSEPQPISFRMFKNLKRLKVAPVYIWGHEGIMIEAEFKPPGSKFMLRDALPQQLEELWVVRADIEDREAAFIPTTLIPALNVLVEDRDACPELSQICIRFESEGWDAAWLEELHHVGLSAKSHGIKCVMRLDDSTDRIWERGWGWDESVTWSGCVHNTTNGIPPIILADEENICDRLEDFGISVERK